MSDPTRLVVGRVRGLHGLRGLIRIEILTDQPEARFAPGQVLFVEGTDAPLTVARAAAVEDGPGWRVAFEEIPDRAAAERLRDAYLEVAVESPALPGGDVYWHEVIGSEVRGREGRALGRVTDVYRAGEREVYVVRGGDVGDFDLAAVKGTVVDFAPERGEIIVDETVLDLENAATPPARAKPRRTRRWSRHGKGAAPASGDGGEGRGADDGVGGATGDGT